MARLLARYALLAAAVVALNFLLPRLLPGDPLDLDAGDGLNPATTTLTIEARARLRATYHLDQPPPAQFASYLRDLARGDLGWSISRAAPVAQLVEERIPWTLGLVLTSVLLAGCGGSLLGLWAAWRGGRTEHALVGAATALGALPEFLVAMLLLVVLGVGLGIFPLQGGRSVFVPASNALAELADIVWHLALPGLTLVVATSTGFVLLANGAARAVLEEPYLMTARAKGASEARVALRHAAPNAVLPVLTLLGLRVGHVLGGAIVVERVFAVPGLGLLAFEAVGARDYPVLQAVFLLGSLSVLLANLAVEIAYRRLEPRHAS